MAHFCFNVYNDDNFEMFSLEAIKFIIDGFLLAATIIMVARPDGLPLAATIVIAYSVNKLMEDQNLVRSLVSCEALGSVNNVCVDKTGTLT